MVLTQGFALDISDAMPLMQEFNVRCQPPWSDGELRHKLSDAAKVSCRKPRGWLLNGRMDLIPAPLRHHAPRPEKTPTLELGDRHSTDQEIRSLAYHRNLSIEGLLLAQNAGLLSFGKWKGIPTWFVMDSPASVAQARRMDGQKWEQIGAKAWTICGQGLGGWPVGASFIGNKPLVALCEGGPDLLAAFHFLFCEEKETMVAPVCMLGASHKIHNNALSLFRGKIVRLFLDCDRPGIQAGLKWARQLVSIGAAVDWVDLSGLRKSDHSKIKDLNDLTSIHADDFEARRNIWNLMEVSND